LRLAFFLPWEKFMDAFVLGGKVAIVTGSTRGIGRSIAEHLARAGAKVVISSRKAPACQEVAHSIRAAGGDAIAIPANIGDKTQLEALVKETRNQCGKIDVLVCNAASNPYYGSMANMPDDAFNKILQNNIHSRARQPRVAGNGAEKRWCNHYCVFHWRTEGHVGARRLCHFQGCRYAAGP
jgi:NAD(P)-dependent dehydrogenase (short-subunit alcohol dehydrogenase family)